MSVLLEQMITYDICKGLYHFGLLSETRSRDQDKTIGRCGDVEMWICVVVDVDVWRCRFGDVEMWIRVDVELWRCVDVEKCRCGDV